MLFFRHMTEKHFINAHTLLIDSFRLARKILESGFRPNFIVGIWRGGTPIGIAVQEFLDFFGISTDHIAIRTSAYEGIDRPGKQILVHGLNYLIKNVEAEDALLIVDDVYDTGLSIQAVIDKIRDESRRNTPTDIRIATVFFKPSRNKTARSPDFYIHETDKWLVFPHELNGLTPDEIRCHKAEVADIFAGLPFPPAGGASHENKPRIRHPDTEE